MSDDETAPEMLERLGTDAMLWAQEFSKTAVKLGYSEMDEGWLIGWFANAIENCDVVRCNPIRSDLAAVTKERDRMREALEEIQNPIEAMQKRADAENAKLNGSMARFLAENANYLRGIARAAIEGVKEPANTQTGER